MNRDTAQLAPSPRPALLLAVLVAGLLLGGSLTGAQANSPPDANDKGAAFPEDTTVTLTLSATDPDDDCPLTFEIVDPPARSGSVSRTRERF